MKKNLLFLAIALYIGGCTYKDDLAKVNFIRKRYRLSTYYYDPYDKYIIYNWRKRAISNITRYDSLGNVTDYCRTLSDDYIYSVTFPKTCSSSRSYCYPSFLLLFHPVHCCLTFMNFS